MPTETEDQKLSELHGMLAVLGALTARDVVEAEREGPETVPALAGFGKPAERPYLAVIGNGLYARTRRTK